MIELTPRPARQNSEYIRAGHRIPASPEDRWRAAASGILDDELLHAMVLMDSRLDATRLNNAVRLVMDSIPILGCRFRPSSAAWERRADLDNISMWMVQVETQRFSMDTRPGVYRYIASPRSPVDNPVFEARLYRSSTDMLVLKAHHAITDSVGLKAILYTIAETYAMLKEDSSYQPPIQAFERDFTPYLADLPFQPLNQVSLPNGNPSWTLPSPTPMPNARPTISIHKVPSSIWQAVKEFMQQRYISLDEIFLAAYYLALDDILTPRLPDELPVILNRDLRGLLPTDLSANVANMSAGFLVSIQLERGNTITDLLPRIRQALQKSTILNMSNRYLAMESDRPDYTLLNQAIKQQRKIELDSLAAIPSLALLGDIESNRLNFGDAKVLDAYLLNPAAYAPRFEVGLSSFEDALTISARYCEDAIDPGMVDSLLRSMVTWLSVF
jgi:NRPS condensation-like uncharacterized protein